VVPEVKQSTCARTDSPFGFAQGRLRAAVPTFTLLRWLDIREERANYFGTARVGSSAGREFA